MIRRRFHASSPQPVCSNRPSRALGGVPAPGRLLPISTPSASRSFADDRRRSRGGVSSRNAPRRSTPGPELRCVLQRTFSRSFRFRDLYSASRTSRGLRRVDASGAGASKPRTVHLLVRSRLETQSNTKRTAAFSVSLAIGPFYDDNFLLFNENLNPASHRWRLCRSMDGRTQAGSVDPQARVRRQLRLCCLHPAPPPRPLRPAGRRRRQTLLATLGGIAEGLQIVPELVRDLQGATPTAMQGRREMLPQGVDERAILASELPGRGLVAIGDQII
jgi:hypothetical protein